MSGVESGRRVVAEGRSWRIYAREVDERVSAFASQVKQFAERRARLTELARREVPADPAASSLEVLAEALGTADAELQTAVEELQAQRDHLEQANLALDAERARYRDLFDNAPDAYLVTTPRGIIREANVAAGRLVGVPPAFLADKELLHFVARGDTREFRHVLRKLAAAPDRAVLTVRLRPRGGGGVVRVSLSATPVRASGATTLLRWLASPAPDSGASAELHQLADAVVACVDALRRPGQGDAARKEALDAIERCAAAQRKIALGLSEPAAPPSGPPASAGSPPSAPRRR